MERLFVIIGKINSLLLLVVLIGVGISVAWLTMANNRWERRGAVEVPEAESSSNKSVLLSFDRFEHISGTNAQMIQLTTSTKSTKFSSGGGGSETRNVVFLTGHKKTARWLFKDNKNLILTVSQLHKDSDESKAPATEGLYFEYVTEDTNGDGVLSSEDHSNVALTKPDGTGFSEILHDVSRVFSREVPEQQYLSLVYQKGTTVRHARFSLSSFKLEVDQEIVSLPIGQRI